MASKRKPNLLRRFLGSLGPGLITGAADDDPSGIATYSIAGAQFGTSLLWTSLITWPLMAAVQMMCARIGMVTGYGLAKALRSKFSTPAVAIAALALLFANIFNIGADLSGMADAAEMLTGVNSHIYVILFGIGISAATVWLRYVSIANTLKWLALFLFAYVLTAFSVHPNWLHVMHDAVVPAVPKGKEAWATVVALLGTTISPYLFFWQASQEVEEEKSIGRLTTISRRGASNLELNTRKLDVGVGTFVSNLVMFFIIVTTALTLHRHGIINIETSRQAAEVWVCWRFPRLQVQQRTRWPRHSAGSKAWMKRCKRRRRFTLSCCSRRRPASPLISCRSIRFERCIGQRSSMESSRRSY
jgi:NRAMP (natural resistance-associated macrophage protein)-like metal ion transporter